uniref:Ionotropic glutamate receptor C-terminal domain-containing protein n=2 Tax=Stomoxys calcitrans TaxID=35570 RepID=A0A1I8PI54_STOCA
MDNAIFNSYNFEKDRLAKTGLMLRCWGNTEVVPNIQLTDLLLGQLIWAQEEILISNICRKVKHDLLFNKFVIGKNSFMYQIVHTCNMENPLKLNSSTLRMLHRFASDDMRRMKVVTESNQVPPRSILYHDAAGNLQLDGFVANCITTFAERYHATLVIIPPPILGQAVFYEVLLNKTSEGLIDIPAMASPYKSTNQRLKSIYYSYPLEITDLCYMIPLPHLMEANKVFVYIIHTDVMIIIAILIIIYAILLTIATQKSTRILSLSNILLNDKSIRVLLGQSFVMPLKPCLFMQYVCFLSCYTSLIISTTYQAYLQSHLIHPAFEKRIETYDDMRSTGMRILITTPNSDFMDLSVYIRNQDLFLPQDSLDKLLKLRDTMDTRYAYPVTNSRWEVFQQQQRLFQRPLFYFSHNLCLKKHVFLAIPMRHNMPYRALFDKHIMELWQMGLMQHWIHTNFYTMVLRNYATFEDLSTPDEFADAIELNDFKWIWAFFAGFLMMASLIFLCELIYFHKFLKLPK